MDYRTWICVVSYSKHFTLKMLRYRSHSSTCKQHHTYLLPS